MKSSKTVATNNIVKTQKCISLRKTLCCAERGSAARDFMMPLKFATFLSAWSSCVPHRKPLIMHSVCAKSRIWCNVTRAAEVGGGFHIKICQRFNVLSKSVKSEVAARAMLTADRMRKTNASHVHSSVAIKLKHMKKQWWHLRMAYFFSSVQVATSSSSDIDSYMVFIWADCRTVCPCKHHVT